MGRNHYARRAAIRRDAEAPAKIRLLRQLLGILRGKKRSLRKKLNSTDAAAIDERIAHVEKMIQNLTDREP